METISVTSSETCLVQSTDVEGRPKTSHSRKIIRQESWAVKKSDDDPKKGNTTQDLQQARRERKPFFYCRWVTDRPTLLFFITLGLQLGLIMLPTGILVLSGYELFPTNFEELPMELYSIPYRLRDFSYRDKDKYDNIFARSLVDTGFPTWERGLHSYLASVDVYYDTENGNIFTQSNLQAIQNIENDLIAAAGYFSYCLTSNTSLTCAKPTSIVRFFDGTYASVDAVFNDPTFSNIPAVLYEAFTNNATKDKFQFFLPKSYTITPTQASAVITRSTILIGCSLSSSYYKCERTAIKAATSDFLSGPMKEKLENHREGTSMFQIYYYSWVIWVTDVMNQAMSDMMFAIGSMFFIFGFMVFHTRSLWIAGFAVLSIITSFMCANIIYRCIIGFEYFGFFHILGIFIVLGIGADDLFVFYDAWRLTAYHSYPSLSHRLSDAYSKSIFSMAFTSLTTMVAFLCSAISPLLATKSFGVFAALTVFIMYLSVVVFFPTVIVVYHTKFEKFKWPCIKFCKNIKCKNTKTEKEAVTNETKNNNDVTKNDIYTIPNGFSNGGFTNHEYQKPEDSTFNHVEENERKSKPNNQEQNDSTTPTKKGKKKEKILVVFFRDRYFKFVTHKFVKWILFPIFLAVLITFAIQASTLQPDNENLRVWKDSHYYSQAIDAEQYRFLQSSADNEVQIYVVWGLANKDRKDCHFSSINCRGDQVYDNSFDPNPSANQQALVNFCNDLYGMSASQIAQYDIKTDSNGNPEVACFTKPLADFLSARGTTLGIDLSLPWDYTKVQNLMTAESTHLDVSLFNSNFEDYLALAMQYWMYNAYNMSYTTDYGMYNDLFGEEKTSWSQQLKTDSNVYYGNKLKYVAVQINTTINVQTLGYSEGIPKADNWEAFINGKVGNMPTGLQKGFQLTREIWHWVYVQKELEKNAILGIAIGVSLSFPILCIATMNIIVGTFATLSICCTTVCVIGVIPTAGWKLGLLTSLNMTMLVGLAVDYVVHLAEGYKNSLHTDRLNRTRDMLEDMGTSVFSGACTTLGASLFMFFAQITFFMQFGIFLFCTIGFSLFFSLGLFTVFMGTIGPQNNIGSLQTLYYKLKGCCHKRTEVSPTHIKHDNV